LSDVKTAEVLSVEIATVTREQLLEETIRLLRGATTTVVGKVPSEFLVRSLEDQDFQTYLRSTAFNVADGIGVLWAARFLTLKTVTLPVARQIQTVWQATYSLASLVVHPEFCHDPIPERIRGLDALFVMMEAAQEAGASVYFLGARAEVNEAARERLKAMFPDLVIAGGQDGYSFDSQATVRAIGSSGAQLLIVALGSPKQEFWIRDNVRSLEGVRVAVGEGGTLDLIAGDYRLTPSWMQKMSLEWLWRLTMHRSNKSGGTSRAHRVWNAVPVFVYRVVRWKLKHGSVGPQVRVSI
jgi:exopolysaccharide biosynthesis WecB/TagA/CpsF family protein